MYQEVFQVTATGLYLSYHLLLPRAAKNQVTGSIFLLLQAIPPSPEVCLGLLQMIASEAPFLWLFRLVPGLLAGAAASAFGTPAPPTPLLATDFEEYKECVREGFTKWGLMTGSLVWPASCWLPHALR